MRKSCTLYPLTTVPRVRPGLRAGPGQYVWPPLLTLLLCLLLLCAAYAAPWQAVQDVGGDAPLLSGVYAGERNQQRSYAFTWGNAAVGLPQLGRGPYELSFTAGAPAASAPRRVVLRAGEERYALGSVTLVRTYHLLLNTPASGDAELRIESDAAPVGADARSLGIMLDRLAVRTVRPMGVPGSMVVTVAAMTALLWLAIVLGVPAVRWRLPLLFGAGLAICAMLIISRGVRAVPVWWLVIVPAMAGVGTLLARVQVLSRRTVPWYWLVALCLAGAALLISRRPDALTNAQFWAEDGSLWYYDAYTLGPLNALLRPHTGYFQTLPRLVAAFSLWFPLARAPLFFNLVALVIQLLPVLLLLSARYAEAIPSFRARLLLAAAYIAVPNREVHVNLTNAQWHLALTAAMVILAQPGRSRAWRCFDVAVCALCAVSGPFCMILAPMCLLRAYVRRERRLLVPGAVLGAGALIQLAAFVVPSGSPRPGDRVPLGVSFSAFARIVGGQVVAQSVLGPAGFAWLSAQAPWMGLLPTLVGAGGLGLAAYALWRGPLELRLFAVFAAWIMAGALVTPVTGSTAPQWEVLALPDAGWRYWRVPVLAFMLMLGYLAYRAPVGAVRWAAVAMLVVAAAANLPSWRYEPWADTHWHANARAFAEAAPGTRVSLPIQPHGWNLALVKR